jgi:RNA polymerase sigma-B factor
VTHPVVRVRVHLSLDHSDRALFRRLRADGDPADRATAVTRYLPLARKLAGRYACSGEPMDDLEQVAAIGLLKAVDRFDPERGTTFSTFAVPTILGELRRHFRDRTWGLRVPRQLQELTVRIEHVRDELTTSLGRQPTLAELSRRLGAADELVLQALELSLARHALSLDAPQRNGEDDWTDVVGQIDDGYARAEARALLAPLLATLSRQEAQVVWLRFSDDLTQDAIARCVGVSQMQVSRVLRRSLGLLREAAG